MTTVKDRPTPRAGGRYDGPTYPNTFLGDVRLVLVRELRPVLRDPLSIVFGLVQPLVFVGLFTPLLIGFSGGALDLHWFVPGVLVMVSLFATASTGSNLQFDMHTGAHERTLVIPVRRAPLLIGRALKEMMPLTLQACVLIAIAVPFGFRPDPLGAVVGLLILAVFGVGFGSLSYALALAVKNQDWMFWTIQQAVLFPLMILSGMLLPLEEGPGWMQAVAAANPLSHIVAAERALFSGVFDAHLLHGALAALAVMLVGLFAGIRAMRRA
ncbi:ABC-2 type transport system permease protein [Nocardiopsis mwathae]|uniref:Transport permease protein n=1 Tax=Nocardiopsis mwathae TaxID=1472723 RepID=A0A7W9YDK9_9ACTN|nr:ABC transporter permease [Nocardiopsis mwathae]MBB6170184.1 ABC-2 type transport system permease protein [Nocardiopsis mwathae]